MPFILIWYQTIILSGHGGGQVVSMVALYYEDPSLNPAEAGRVLCKIYVKKNKNK